MDGGRGRGGVVAAVVPFRQGRSRNRLRAGIKVAHRGMKRLTPGDSVNLVIGNDEHGNSGRGQQSSATRERRLKRGRRGRRRKKGGKKEEKKKGVEGGEKKNGRREMGGGGKRKEENERAENEEGSARLGESDRERERGREGSAVSFRRECPEGRRNNASWRNYILLLSPTRTKAREEKTGDRRSEKEYLVEKMDME